MVGIATGFRGDLHGIPVDPHQLGERLAAAVLNAPAGRFDDLDDVVRDAIEAPHQAPRTARGDRSVAVFADGIRLDPCAGRLASFQRSLLGDVATPAGGEHDELAGAGGGYAGGQGLVAQRR